MCNGCRYSSWTTSRNGSDRLPERLPRAVAVVQAMHATATLTSGGRPAPVTYHVSRRWRKMGKHIAIIGAGAVGGYVGGHLARAGEDVSLVDPWPEHVDAIRQRGLRLGGTQGEHTVRVRALHLTDIQSFSCKPVDIAIISTKSYD